ncbi:MAG: dockerin type I repeat-containing protein [Ruminococcus sp.]|nr:dockerin type I repeat-containing protein [Ruminococcus sp.]
MKKNKIISALISAVMIGSTAAALPAGAVFFTGTEAGIQNRFPGHTAYGPIEAYTSMPGNDLVLLETADLPEEYSFEIYDIVVLSKRPDFIKITPAEGADLSAYTDRIKAVDSELAVTMKKNGICEITKAAEPEAGKDQISVSTAQAVYEIMKDDVTEFTYSAGNFYGKTDVTAFNIFTHKTDETNEELFSRVDAYLADNYSGITAAAYAKGEMTPLGTALAYDSVILTYPEGTTAAQKIAVTEALYKNTGAVMKQSSQEASVVSGGTSFDLCELVPGDANFDGVTDIADAVLIQQYLVNPEKYPISVPGLINGDITGGGDGVTGLDALEIQKIEANSK